MARLSLFVLLWTGMTSAGGAERVVVPEGDEALLPCSLSTKEDLTLKLFDWRKDREEVFLYEAGSHYNNGRQGQDEQFKGRVFHFEGELKNGDASIKIINTTVADSGNYTCDFPLHQPRKTFLIELVVGGVLRDRSGEISGAAPEPGASTGGIVAGVLACLITLFVVVLVVLCWKGYVKCSRPRPRPSKKEEEEEMNHHS